MNLPLPKKLYAFYHFKVRFHDQSEWITPSPIYCNSLGEAIHFLRMTWKKDLWIAIPNGVEKKKDAQKRSVKKSAAALQQRKDGKG